MSAESVTWTGKNTGEVKAWVMTHVIDTTRLLDERESTDRIRIAYFVKRRGSHMTEALWANVLPGSTSDITAAVWVDAEEQYVGLRDGDAIAKHGRGFMVDWLEPQ